MLLCIEDAISHPPEYSDGGLVGFRVNALLWYLMATPSGILYSFPILVYITLLGFAAFRDPRVNAAFKEILSEYGAFLKSPASTESLHEDEGGMLYYLLQIYFLTSYRLVFSECSGTSSLRRNTT